MRVSRGWLIWAAVCALVLWVATALAVAWGVRHALVAGDRMGPQMRAFLVQLSRVPGGVKTAWQAAGEIMSGAPVGLLIDRSAVERAHWQRRFPAPEDAGYLLFSGVSAQAKQSVVELIRIRDGAVLARWQPQWSKILSLHAAAPDDAGAAARALHPLLLDDGDIVFNANYRLVRQSPCGGAPVWMIDEPAHHSIERSTDGQLWVASVSHEGLADNPWLKERVRDDAIAKVSPDGRVLSRWSMAKILRDNDLTALMLGMSGFALATDPIHLNQITEAQRDSPWWRRGDLLLSARHLSTVFLYRPATGKIIWHQTGPWMNQHAVSFVGDAGIAVFDNNVFGGAPAHQPFVVEGDVNRVRVYRFDRDAIEEPYRAVLAAARPVTLTEGRAQLLDDGGLFVEETNTGRLLRFSRAGLMWSRVNDFDAERIGVVSWSRYLSAQDVAAPLAALAARGCGVR